MKKYLIDLCYEDGNIRERNLEMDEEFIYSIKSSLRGCLDKVSFKEKDIDKRYMIIGDGGDFFKLKDGRIFNVCIRGQISRIWEEDDKELIEFINNLISKCK